MGPSPDGPHISQIVSPILIFHFNKFGHWSQPPLLHSFVRNKKKIYLESICIIYGREYFHFPTHSRDLSCESFHESVFLESNWK